MTRLSTLVSHLQKILSEGKDYKVQITTDGILYDEVHITWDPVTKELILSNFPTEEKAA